MEFSILTQNVGPLVWPAPYLGTDRPDAAEETIVRDTGLIARHFGTVPSVVQ